MEIAFLRYESSNKQTVIENLLKLCHQKNEILNRNICYCKTSSKEFQ